VVDALRAHDIERARSETPATKLFQALELMEAGFRLKRRALRTRYPNASEEEIQRLFLDWLFSDE
jgi:hypothetical protein